MPERGRPAASAGNAYHDVTTAMRIVEMLQDGQIDYVWPEAMSPVDDIVVARSDGADRMEQVKQKAPGRAWTPASLQSEGILAQFISQHRSTPKAVLVLVTGSDAQEIRALCERAASARANNPGGLRAAAREWERRLGGDLQAVATDLRERANMPQTRLVDLLATVRIEDNQGLLDQRRDLLRSRLGGLVDHPERGAEVLETLAREAAIDRRKLYRHEVEKALTEGDIGPRLSAWAVHLDLSAYADRLDRVASELNVSGLPMLPRTVRVGASEIATEDLPGRCVLVGGHGSGKSRLSVALAAIALQTGHLGLHVRLGQWATNLEDLIGAELAGVANREVDHRDVQQILTGSDALLVFDSLDEVVSDDRDRASREIAQFAQAHPHIRMLVTTRPGRGFRLSEWTRADLQPLTHTQIAEILGRPWLRLEPGVRSLAGNPLMLGMLLDAERNDQPLGRSEGELLDGFIDALIGRQASRGPMDIVTGSHVAEEAAYEWLQTGRVALDDRQLRTVAVSVARTLYVVDRLTIDAREIEDWLIEAGLAVRVGASVVPMHRTLLDQLAARRIDRSGVAVPIAPELREALARYIGRLSEVGEPARGLLRVLGRDFEALARCRHLVRPDVRWVATTEEFALDYHTALRALAGSVLQGVDLIPSAVHIQVDAELKQIYEYQAPSIQADRVEVLSGDVRAAAPRPEEETGPRSYRSRTIDVQVPQLMAYERARAELQEQVRRRNLVSEGREITYERLSTYAGKFADVVERGKLTLPDLEPKGLTRIPPRELQRRFGAVLASVMGRNPTSEEIGTALLAYDYQSGQIIVATGARPSHFEPRAPDAGWRGLVVHGAPLLALVDAAERLGIADLPLHPLGVLPTSDQDPLLQLPDWLQLLHGDALVLFVERQELGAQHALRHLVENNLSGLAQRLWTYQSLPRRVRLLVDDQSTGNRIAVTVFREVDERADAESVTGELGRPHPGQIVGWAGISWYRSVTEMAYGDLERDLNDVLSGQRALGQEDL